VNDHALIDDEPDLGFFGTEGVDGAEALDPAVVGLVDELIARAPDGREGLLGVLLGIQRAFDRVSWRVQELVADLFGLSPAQVAAIVSYYPELSADRRGRLKIHVCSGPSCHIGGGDGLLETLAEEISDRNPTSNEDPRVALDRQGCMGACDRAPVIRAAERIYDGLGKDEARHLLDRLLDNNRNREGDR
jgi:NADH:ubiquinone oxidoreductase subunit E